MKLITLRNSRTDGSSSSFGRILPPVSEPVFFPRAAWPVGVGFGAAAFGAGAGASAGGAFGAGAGAGAGASAGGAFVAGKGVGAAIFGAGAGDCLTVFVCFDSLAAAAA